jgi:hypothetical protein
LYTLTKARASAIIKQEEDLTVRVRQVNQRAQDVEELDDIKLCHELDVLSTRVSTLEHRDANLDREQKALEDVCA